MHAFARSPGSPVPDVDEDASSFLHLDAIIDSLRPSMAPPPEHQNLMQAPPPTTFQQPPTPPAAAGAGHRSPAAASPTFRYIGSPVELSALGSRGVAGAAGRSLTRPSISASGHFACATEEPDKETYVFVGCHPSLRTADTLVREA